MRPSSIEMFHGVKYYILFVIATLALVHSQPTSSGTSLENQLKANLTRMVKFIVHPSARQSKELFSFALASGGTPKTDQERLLYLALLKKIARNTPELVKKFTVITTKPDGTESKSLDELAIDVHLTTKALQFVQREQSVRAFHDRSVIDIVNSISPNSSASNTTV